MAVVMVCSIALAGPALRVRGKVHVCASAANAALCKVTPASPPPCAPEQYDIELVKQIEALVGQEFEQYEADEAEVLKGITKVGCCQGWVGVGGVGLSDSSGGRYRIRRWDCSCACA